MSKPTGGPAFPHAFQELDRQGMPCTQAYFQEGMTLRDYFAAKTMQGIWANADILATLPGSQEAQRIAQMGYEQADAMLAERDK